MIQPHQDNTAMQDDTASMLIQIQLHQDDTALLV